MLSDDESRSTGRDVSREYADELGRQEKAGGKDEVTGSDLSDSDARIYGLRKAGYDGWLDRDGYMV